MTIPDTLGPVVGVRAWFMSDTHLYGLYMPARWDGGRATCWRRCNNTPLPGCTCGYYLVEESWAAPNKGLVTPTVVDATTAGYPLVLGRARGWGRVIPHEHGWRCEYAAPLELFTPADAASEMRAHRVAATYDISVVDPPDWMTTLPYCPHTPETT